MDNLNSINLHVMTAVVVGCEVLIHFSRSREGNVFKVTLVHIADVLPASGHQVSGRLAHILGFVVTLGAFNDVEDGTFLASDDIRDLE